jgi:hypothetical protein
MELKGFFAYPSNPSIVEVIEDAVTSINGANVVNIQTWEKIKTSGQSIISVICDEISSSDIFLCDLTYLNSNVLFELGYAIGKNKRVVVFLDPSIEKAKNDYERFNLSTLGYLPYSNASSMVERFFAEEPYNNLDRTILSEISNGITHQDVGMLYLKSAIETQASVKLHQRLEKTKIKPLVIDDPQEIRMQMHQWYVEKVISSFAVVGHLLSDEHSGRELHNAKVAFVIGLAYGLNKKVIMLAHEPYRTPLDYRHLLKRHSTAIECEKAFDSWIKDVEQDFLEKEKKAVAKLDTNKSIVTLKGMDIGDYIAEQEYERIRDYFVETAAYREALKSRYTIFIGRKGSGKSAILYQLDYELSDDPRNHVCVIKPISYELNGLIAVLKRIEGNAEKGFLVESLWKYLIYTEIAKSIYEMLSEKPDYYELRDYEKVIKSLIDNNQDIFLNDFSVRLELVILKFGMLDNTEKGYAQRIRISEILHDNLLGKLRDALFMYFEHRSRVVVLIDNLDKTWKHTDDIVYLSQFLLGLLSVSNRIADDFRYEKKADTRTQFSMVIFLRTDIFTFIYREARERDKIKYYNITWDDPELLCQIVEARFFSSLGSENSVNIWEKYFPPSVNGVPVKDYLSQNVMARPRDVLFYVKCALANAVSRRHERISEKDMIDAQERYSQHAIDSLIVENGISVEDFETLLYEFAGQKKVLSKTKIEEIVNKSNVKNVDVDYFLELLCERCFLGRQIGDKEFRYQTNHLDYEKILALAKNYQEEKGVIEYFEINIPYRKYLEIKD